MRGAILILLLLGTGCANIQTGYLLSSVAMDQPRIGSCSNYTINEGAPEVIMEQCGNWLGCTYFQSAGRPAEIWYLQGHDEILQHEVDHCLAGGPLHEVNLAGVY